MQLTPFAQDIYTYEGSTVGFYGFPYTTRMTVIRLPGDVLFVHSPEKLNDELRGELANLGQVRYLVSPNKLHHLFLTEWIDAYPNAITYASPGLAEKRQDIDFHHELCNAPETDWADEIDQLIFHGSSVMEEVVFYHKSSATLVVTDLIENFEAATFNWWQRPLARLTGIVAPTGKMPVDWRMTFIFGDRSKARADFKKILAWQPEHIILSHGLCIRDNALEFLARSFHWLTK
jgi:hypothetical protein